MQPITDRELLQKIENLPRIQGDSLVAGMISQMQELMEYDWIWELWQNKTFPELVKTLLPVEQDRK